MFSLALEDWLAALAAIAIPLVLLIAAIVLRVIGHVQRYWQRRVGRLEITNLGNVRSCYELAVEEDIGALEFRFTHAGAALPTRMAPRANLAPSEAHTPDAAPAPASGQVVSQGLRLGSAVEDALMAAGRLLPGSLGTPLTNLAGGLREAGYTVREAQDARERMDNLAKEVAPRSPNGKHPPPAPAPASRPPTSGLQPWARTPYLDPGAALALELVIVPRPRARDQVYPFRIISRTAEQEQASIILEQGRVEIRRPSWLWRALSAITVLGALAVAGACAAYLAFSFGLFG